MKKILAIIVFVTLLMAVVVALMQQSKHSEYKVTQVAVLDDVTEVEKVFNAPEGQPFILVAWGEWLRERLKLPLDERQYVLCSRFELAGFQKRYEADNAPEPLMLSDQISNRAYLYSLNKRLRYPQNSPYPVELRVAKP
ncbi:MAG: hypothetical protein IAE77_04075 [Prosthecobacter sp.]|jgi:hypothetical protein|uniref:hypothetical protein n=1 Tax=Prosthecobacter sp. TaxID=1965333 RepID=UPI0019E7684C|nr:hypothetical protein [Prosthecobacter sp.]MBE2282622.1 hypothetical protein [Prosthecobacter sp.]